MAFKNLRVFSGQLTDNEITWVQSGTGGVVNLQETTAQTSIPGYGKLYVKSSDHNLYFLNSSGVEYNLLDTSGGGYTTIQEEGTTLTQRAIMNFVGAGITAADDATNLRTNITLSATLNSLANLGTGADKIAYTTGVGVWAETPLTAFGRSLIGDADAATARTNLGLAIGTDVQAYHANLQSLSGLTYTSPSFVKMTAAGTFSLDTTVLGTMATQNANAVSITGGSITGITDLAIADGGTGASDAATARTNLGLAIGTDVQAYHANLQSLSGLTYTSPSFVKMTAAGTFSLDTTVLGTMATQNANAVSITGGSITGITDLAIADGGTGASDAATARTNLGLAIGTDVQAWSANLDTWSTKTPPSSVVVGTTDAQSLSNKRLYPRQNTQTSPTSITPDKSQYDEYYVTALANAITINNATSPSVGDIFVIYLTDNGTAQTISFGTNYAAIGATLPTTTTANKTMEIIIKYVTTTKALVSSSNQQ